QDLDQSRLAGAILAKESVDFAAPQREVDIVERGDAKKALADAAGFQEGSFVIHKDVLGRTTKAPCGGFGRCFRKRGGGKLSYRLLTGRFSSRGPSWTRRPSSGHQQPYRAWIPSGSTSAALSCPSDTLPERRRPVL